MDNHNISDFARDTVSELVAGLCIVAVTGGFALYRHFRDRLGRHGIEIRHTQDKTNTKPVFPEYPADKL